MNESVIACDISATGLTEQILDVAVFSLSLMGLNYQDYPREAYHLVQYGGWLKIAEPTSRWKERNQRAAPARQTALRSFARLQRAPASHRHHLGRSDAGRWSAMVRVNPPN